MVFQRFVIFLSKFQRISPEHTIFRTSPTDFSVLLYTNGVANFNEEKENEIFNNDSQSSLLDLLSFFFAEIRSNLEFAYQMVSLSLRNNPFLKTKCVLYNYQPENDEH